GSMTIASAFNSSSINTTNHNVGSLSLNDPADLMISVAACNNSVSSWSGNWTDNFTQLAAVNGSNSAMAIAEQIDISAGNYSTTTTTTTPRKTNAFLIALAIEEEPPINVTSVTVTPQTLDMNVGDMSELATTTLPTNADDQGVSWSSSNTSVATVNIDGFVTAISEGSATITCTTSDGGLTDTCGLTVTEYPVPAIEETFTHDASNFTVVDGGTWSISNERYVLSNPKTFTTSGLLGQISVHNTALIQDFTIGADVRITGTTEDWDDLALIFNYQDSSNYYYVSLNENSTANIYTQGVFKVENDIPTELENITTSISTDVDYLVEVVRTGSQVEVYIDGNLVASPSDSTFSGGQVGLGSKNNAGEFDNFIAFGDSTTVVAIAGDGFINNPFATQANQFQATFSATPSSSLINAQIALSNGDAAAYDDLAAIVRFNDSGNIDARSGNVYLASQAIPYITASTYHFRMEVDITNHSYSVFVTPDGGTELAVGEDLDFRVQQSNVSNLNTWVAHVDANAPGTSLTVGSFAIGFSPSSVSKPTASPSSGIFQTTQNVTISTATSGATIRYTTDGSTPSDTNGIIYSGPISVGNDTTIKAIAYKNGLLDSSVLTETYIITSQVQAPQFSPSGGAYNSAQSVTLTSATNGAEIRYTTDGSTPTPTHGTVYSGSIAISSNTTLKAVAHENGMNDSAVISEDYVINTGPALYPTHPNEVGLTGVGIDRDNLPESSTYVFKASDAGTVITDLKFNQVVRLKPGADNITFKRCWFKGNGTECVKSDSTSSVAINTTFEDCDFGQYGAINWNSSANVRFLGGTNYFKRCYFYNSGDSIKFFGGSINHLEYCWLQPIIPSGSDKHSDAMQLDNSVKAEFYAYRCTFELRSFKSNNEIAHSHEELSDANVTVSSYGNGIFQSKPCGTNGGCNGTPVAGCYYSWIECLMTGGNYIGTIEDQLGEFVDNVVIRGTGQSDQGLRNAQNMTISGNSFHDNGDPYNGGGVGKESNITPIPDLGL
ncbi:chitobiase/beta-hexosaminidase C-terminal domain-containing protein, partial [Puniceicoccaceae bacterium K14]|nr:chitobiase/beta-hexosaminidase C-terminal domain-containing protein [Puniceicoccaceae bacterium K14]